MARRKNTRRFDPRYFMDEKTDLIKEGAVRHSAHHIVKKMKKTGKSAKETLKSLTTDLSDEEAERWLKRHKDEMESAEEDLKSQNEAMYEPGRAVADIDTGEERMSPEEVAEEDVRDLAAKFNVEAFVETASDGKTAILVFHQGGEPVAYNDTEEMYQDLASRQEIDIGDYNEETI